MRMLTMHTSSVTKPTIRVFVQKKELRGFTSIYHTSPACSLDNETDGFTPCLHRSALALLRRPVRCP
jgi:hypothetical protein